MQGFRIHIGLRSARLRRVIIALTATASMAVAAQPLFAAFPTPPPPDDPNCSPNINPVGQADPTGEMEPFAPIWCFNLAQEPVTRVTGANDWVDDFRANVQMGRLNDGDMDYRIFDNYHNDKGANHTQHWINNFHWMTDTAGSTDNGDGLRPNRSFTFENGKLVVEADIAAGQADYGNGVVWPEMTVSMAPQPTGDIVDSLYAYGAFGGAWTVGCRLNPGGVTICAVQSGAHDIPTRDESRANCFAGAPSRVMEISDTQQCGSIHQGGNRFGDNAQYWRHCDPNQMDMFCKDRIRMELTKSSLTLYVNGHMYFRDADWPAERQLPDSMVNGGKVYAYFSDWRARPTAQVYRFHWGHLAVNPHDPATGELTQPSASPFFCLDNQANTCDWVWQMSLGLTPSMPVPAMATPMPAMAPPQIDNSMPSTDMPSSDSPADDMPSDTDSSGG
jgi:hypothetical protein